eukprot:m.105123 g.105123  ORF g.105123 m.105123 type:complete len:94 (-) comp13866_c0_seq5:1098-1379(-)
MNFKFHFGLSGNNQHADPSSFSCGNFSSTASLEPVSYCHPAPHRLCGGLCHAVLAPLYTRALPELSTWRNSLLVAQLLASSSLECATQNHFVV